MCEGEQRLIELVFGFLLIENILEKYIPFFNYTDEFITIFAIVGILFQGSKITLNKYERKVLVSVFFIVIIGLMGNLIFGYQESTVAISKDILALIKFFAVYLFCTIRFKRGISQKALAKIEKISALYCLILAFFGIVSQFINLGMTNDRSIFGLKAFVFLYSHETFLVSAVVIMVSVLISCGIRRNRYGILSGVIVLLLAMRSKAIIFVTVFTGMYVFFHRKKSIERFIKKHKANLVIALTCMIGIIYFFTRDKIALYINFGLTAARPALYIVSSKIMLDCFPIGSGFATFASHLSTAYHSPLYEIYGIAGVSGLTQLDNYAYVSDTYWPYIIAQFGVIGTNIYIYSLMCILKNTVRQCSHKNETLIAAISMFAYGIAACFVESYLTNATVILFAITLGFILNQPDKKLNITRRSVNAKVISRKNRKASNNINLIKEER